MSTTFRKLNVGWNAEPNSPDPEIRAEGQSVVLSFALNHMVSEQFSEGDRGRLRFERCWRYRLGPTNDEGWYLGKCRFSQTAPSWGDFYEVAGDLMLDGVAGSWTQTAPAPQSSKHFLFYFRDNTFECDAESWEFAVKGDVATSLPGSGHP